MKKALPIVVVAVVVIAGLAAFLSMHKNNTKSASNMNTMSSSNQSTSSQPEATNKVSIANFAFSPANITVKKGTTVTWTNQDSIAHTVTETDGKTGPNSGDLAKGKSYSFTFDTVGTFKYHCTVHPDMVGTVTVTE